MTKRQSKDLLLVCLFRRMVSALYEISRYDFTKENGELIWSTSKEFIEVFNEQILGERK